MGKGLSNMRFPRQLEFEQDPETIRRTLTERTARLWSGGDLDVPLITTTDPLRNALRTAVLKGQIRYGFEGIGDRLKKEEAGITSVRERHSLPQGERISRLILFSNDGAARFYRHIEHLLRSYAPRVLGCLLDMDSSALGKLITGKDRQIKVIMAEHKDAVSEILRAIIGADRGS